VLRLLNDRELHRRMGRRARQAARQRFSIDEMVGRYMAVYESMR